MTKKILVLIFLVPLLNIACNKASNKDAASPVKDVAIVDGGDITPVLLLKNMDDEELEAVSEACPADSEHARCVVICHIPPGNVGNAKTLLIPHQAVNAHIHHGGDKHEHHDFIGNCDQLPELNGDDKCHADDHGNGNGKGHDKDKHANKHHDKTHDCSSNDDDGSGDDDTDNGTGDDGSDNGTGDDGSGETDPGTDDGSNGGMDNGNNGPIYCDYTSELDLDCDGLDDTTGTPLF